MSILRIFRFKGEKIGRTIRKSGSILMKQSNIGYLNEKESNEVVFELGVQRRFFRSIYETPFKLKKQRWHGCFSDKDVFIPSCPHLHSEDDKYKLNVYTGEIYDRRRRIVLRDKYVPNDELKKLWDDQKFKEFADKMRDYYKEERPNSKLPDIPKF